MYQLALVLLLLQVLHHHFYRTVVLVSDGVTKVRLDDRYLDIAYNNYILTKLNPTIFNTYVH